MKDYEFMELLREVITLNEESLTKYMYYIKGHIYRKCTALCEDKKIFMDSYEFEHLVFNTESELYIALKKFDLCYKN